MTVPSNGKFGLELSKHLNSRAMMEADLVRAMGSIGIRISRQYVNMLVRNIRTPGPDLIEALGDSLKLAREDRVILHRAAALDCGYRIGRLRE